MVLRCILLLCAVVVSLACWACPVSAYVSWSDTGVDMGIGVVGLRPASGSIGTTVCGFPETNAGYAPEFQKLFNMLVFRRQPHDTHPEVGRWVFSQDGVPGIQTPDAFYPLIHSGIPLGDGTVGMIATQRQGQWVEVVLNHAPRVTGWVRLSHERPLAFWLWYHYIDQLVKTRQRVVFITAFHDDLLYQPDPRSLSYLKHVFQMEDAVLRPVKLAGAFMLVELEHDTLCHHSSMPQLEQSQPVRAWIRWIEDNGRPRIFRYQQPACP